MSFLETLLRRATPRTLTEALRARESLPVAQATQLDSRVAGIPLSVENLPTELAPPTESGLTLFLEKAKTDRRAFLGGLRDMAAYASVPQKVHMVEPLLRRLVQEGQPAQNSLGASVRQAGFPSLEEAADLYHGLMRGTLSNAQLRSILQPAVESSILDRGLLSPRASLATLMNKAPEAQDNLPVQPFTSTTREVYAPEIRERRFPPELQGLRLKLSAAREQADALMEAQHAARRRGVPREELGSFDSQARPFFLEQRRLVDELQRRGIDYNDTFMPRPKLSSGLSRSDPMVAALRTAIGQHGLQPLEDVFPTPYARRFRDLMTKAQGNDPVLQELRGLDGNAAARFLDDPSRPGPLRQKLDSLFDRWWE